MYNNTDGGFGLWINTGLGDPRMSLDSTGLYIGGILVTSSDEVEVQRAAIGQCVGYRQPIRAR